MRTTRVTGFSGLGHPLLALVMIGLGIVGLYTGDFASVWQRIPFDPLPGRTYFAYATAIIELLTRHWAAFAPRHQNRRGRAAGVLRGVAVVEGARDRGRAADRGCVARVRRDLGDPVRRLDHMDANPRRLGALAAHPVRDRAADDRPVALLLSDRNGEVHSFLFSGAGVLGVSHGCGKSADLRGDLERRARRVSPRRWKRRCWSPSPFSCGCRD